MTEDIDVPVGSYWKSHSGVIKYVILDDVNAMQVTSDGWNVFKMKGSWFLNYFEDNQPSTREEFFSALKETQLNLSSLTSNL